MFNSGQTWKSYSLDKKKSAYVTTYARNQSRIRTCSSGMRTYAMYANCQTLRLVYRFIKVKLMWFKNQFINKLKCIFSASFTSSMKSNRFPFFLFILYKLSIISQLNWFFTLNAIFFWNAAIAYILLRWLKKAQC